MFSLSVSTLTFAYDSPVADAGPDQTVLEGAKVSFDGSNSTGEIVSYSWDFGDGSKASGQVEKHVYSRQGVYTVTLTVKDWRSSSKDTVTVTVAKPLQLFFHKYTVVTHSEDSSAIAIEGADALQPSLGVGGYEEVKCLQQYEQEGQSVWVGYVMFLTSPLPKDLYVAGNVAITCFVNSTDSFTSKQYVGYTFSVMDVNETGGIVAAFQSDIRSSVGKNPLTPKPKATTLIVEGVDNVFKEGHRIGFSIGLGGNRKGWRVGVIYDSTTNSSGVILPITDPPQDFSSNVTFGEKNHLFVVRSNSSISAFQFNAIEKAVSFKASMVQGTGGFCNVSVPKSLMGGPYIVTLNGVSKGFSQASNSTYAFIFFDYVHGEQAIAVTLRNVG